MAVLFTLLSRNIRTNLCCRLKYAPVSINHRLFSDNFSKEVEKIKNKNVSRPLSPHVTIWKWTLPPILSIVHRGTGIFMTGVLMFIAVGSIIVGPESLLRWIKSFLHPILLLLAKLGVVFSLSYHALNGCRHLGWDFGKGLKTENVYKTGRVIITLAIIITLITAFLCFDEKDIRGFKYH